MQYIDVSQTSPNAVDKIVMQVYWLLTAIAQDQPKNKAVGELRDNCERAALEGSWVRTAVLPLLSMLPLLRCFILTQILPTQLSHHEHLDICIWSRFCVLYVLAARAHHRTLAIKQADCFSGVTCNPKSPQQ